MRTKHRVGAWAAVLVALTCDPSRAGEEHEAPPHHRSFLHALAPVGGWNPYGGGVFHWWNPHCFPSWCGPDDYCRKPPPQVCRPFCLPARVSLQPAGR